MLLLNLFHIDNLNKYVYLTGNLVGDIKKKSIALENYLWRRELPADKELLFLKVKHFEEMFRKEGRLIVAPSLHQYTLHKTVLHKTPLMMDFISVRWSKPGNNVKGRQRHLRSQT